MKTINSFDELISFLEEHDLTNDQVAEIVTKALKIYVAPENTTTLIKKIKEYWRVHGNVKERPLFIDETQ